MRCLSNRREPTPTLMLVFTWVRFEEHLVTKDTFGLWILGVSKKDTLIATQYSVRHIRYGKCSDCLNFYQLLYYA
jgi:hypothetical protein